MLLSSCICESSCCTCIKRPSSIAWSLLLLHDLHISDHHAVVDRLDHVVDGQQGYGDRSQCLHLDAGPTYGPDLRPDPHARQLFLQARLDLHMVETQGVAERD